MAAVALLAACSGDEDRSSEPAPPPAGERAPEATPAPAAGDAGPVHVHALGRNPADGALFIATHTGLFREPRAGATPRRVGNRWQDTMGFTVVGPDRFLASGHPDGRENLPPFLGLIESSDAGRSWTPVSLQGEMDFHVLEAAGRRIYGFGADWETRAERLLVSDDRGRSWDERPAPEPLLDLAVDPRDPETAVAAGAAGVHLSVDAGRSWRPLGGDPGLLVWTTGGLYSVDREGVLSVARDDLRRWETVGRVGGEPAALAASGAHALYVALHDGTIKRSADGGVSWHTGAPAGIRARERPSDQGPVSPFEERSEALRDLGPAGEPGRTK